jgi:hypothetical protein
VSRERLDTLGFIDRSSATRLAEIEITTLDDFLDRCARRHGRREVGRSTGISDDRLHRWAEMAELMRIEGIDSRYAELLAAAGVHSMRDLREQDGRRLADMLLAVNEARRFTNLVPSAAVVGGWIDRARRLEPRVDAERPE